ncbi:hypothetical protein Bbelb_244040 [Branchiostoma belcheri]|nr:hypothetical protein Bbelb_244040 [Branchiostoma belcheri]
MAADIPVTLTLLFPGRVCQLTREKAGNPAVMAVWRENTGGQRSADNTKFIVNREDGQLVLVQAGSVQGIMAGISEGRYCIRGPDTFVVRQGYDGNTTIVEVSCKIHELSCPDHPCVRNRAVLSAQIHLEPRAGHGCQHPATGRPVPGTLRPWDGTNLVSDGETASLDLRLAYIGQLLSLDARLFPGSTKASSSVTQVQLPGSRADMLAWMPDCFQESSDVPLSDTGTLVCRFGVGKGHTCSAAPAVLSFGALPWQRVPALPLEAPLSRFARLTGETCPPEAAQMTRPSGTTSPLFAQRTAVLNGQGRSKVNFFMCPFDVEVAGGQLWHAGKGGMLKACSVYSLCAPGGLLV